MSYVKCNEEIELYVQFVTNWAVVGMPKCWAEYDPFFEGVTDVFCYNIVCADTAYCDIEQACGFEVRPEQTDALLCTSADECDTCLTKLFAFNDRDQTGTFDPMSDQPIDNIKLNIYLDYAQSIIVDSQITDSTGNANFQLAPGTYYVNYDQTYGNGTNFSFNYSLPWIIVVLDGCDTLWPGWNEDGNLPFSENRSLKPLV
jgi:hypothetical protein